MGDVNLEIKLNNLNKEVNVLADEVGEISNQYIQNITDKGLLYSFAKIGRVVTVTCLSGTLTETISVNGTIITLPDNLKPIIQTESISIDKSARIIFLTDGRVITTKEFTSGTGPRFSLTYISK